MIGHVPRCLLNGLQFGISRSLFVRAHVSGRALNKVLEDSFVLFVHTMSVTMSEAVKKDARTVNFDSKTNMHLQ